MFKIVYEVTNFIEKFVFQVATVQSRLHIHFYRIFEKKNCYRGTFGKKTQLTCAALKFDLIILI